jgi:thermitase
VAAIYVILVCAGCGERSASITAVSPSPEASARNTALLLPTEAGNPFIPRPPTWQDTRGFTAGVDYYPDEILVMFADELAGEVDGGAGSGLGRPPINTASMLFANIDHARFARKLGEEYGLSIIQGCEAYVAGFNYCGYRLPPVAEAELLMQRILDENPVNVRLVEYNPIYTPCNTPDDPKVQDGTQLYHDASHMNDFGAWDSQTGDPEVYVAVIDTGADMDHPDLVDNILDLNTLWPGEDFDLGESDTWPQDILGHGSHCCGIAAATGDNTKGGAGVAYEGGILPIKVTNAQGDFIGSISGIVLAVQCEASVISMSFGSYMPSDTLKEACEYAYLNGTLPVAAAGNDNNGAQIHYPAGIPVCIAVGAVNSSDDKASFSNYGPWVDSVAPGVNIYSTVFNDTYRGDYSGTSMACPMVAGAALLLMAEYGDTLSLDQIRGLIESTGDPVSDAQWRNDYVTRVNTANALAASAGTAPVVDITNLSNDQNVTGLVDINCEATDDGTIERAFLYIDGLLVDELNDPGSSFGFSYDATDEYPGEMNVLVEVVDDDFIHGFDERVVVVTDSYFMPIPYYNSFDGLDTSHWTQYNISGEAYWHLYEEAPGDFAMRLGDPSLTPPKYRQRDVDWLMSPLFDLSSVENAKVVFTGDWSFSSGKLMMMAVYGENGSGYFDIYSPDNNPDVNSYDYSGNIIFSLSSIVGSAIQFYWLLDGNDAGGQRWFQFDDFYIATPTELPLVLFNDPVDGQVVSGVVDLDLRVYDDHLWQVDRCEVYVNGELYDTTYAPDWGLTLDTGVYANGLLNIIATAYEYDLYDNDEDGSLEDKVSAELALYVGHHDVASIAPSEGFYYDPVTITGSGFGDYAEGQTVVTFAGDAGRAEAPVQSWTDGSIEVLVPVGAVTGKVDVSLNGAVRESAQIFVVATPYDDFGYEFVDPPADMMFDQTFSVRVFAQPDLDSVTIRIAGAAGKEWNITTRGNENDVVAEVNIGGLTTGAYELEVEGFRGAYSETLSGTFYLNTLPGDFDSSGTVDDGDTAFLELFLAANGELAEGTAGFLPFLDVNDDGFINEGDAPFVGYHWGDMLE